MFEITNLDDNYSDFSFSKESELLKSKKNDKNEGDKIIKKNFNLFDFEENHEDLNFLSNIKKDNSLDDSFESYFKKDLDTNKIRKYKK